MNITINFNNEQIENVCAHNIYQVMDTCVFEVPSTKRI